MSDLIKREDAIKAYNEAMEELVKWQMEEWQLGDFSECEFNTTDCKHIVRKLEAIPSADTDLGEYSDKLWKNAYERGKADRPQEWIPCSERLPKPYTAVLVCDECGWISLGVYRPCDVTEKDSGWSTLTRIKLPTDEVLAWMPLPKPWKGAFNE